MEKMAVIAIVALTFLFSVAGAEELKPKKEKKPKAQMAMDHKGGHANHKDHDHKSGEQSASIQSMDKSKLVVKVEGMVCAFCAQGIKKNFNALAEVKDTKVDLDTMEVTVMLKDGKSLAKAKIQEVITGAGFKFVGLK